MIFSERFFRGWPLLVFGFMASVVFAVLVFILGHIILEGLPHLSWEFLTENPEEGMRLGGIFPAIVGTALVTFVSGIAALPLGVATAIYLTEYAQDTWFTRAIKLAIRNLSGVPSIVYGLFGLALFIQIFKMRPGVLSAGMTLGLLTLPGIITTSEEALKAVPKMFREGAWALGATPWYSIRSVILPPALPGILTGVILGLARAAGETAPILFVGVSFYLPDLPKGAYDQFMALPYHLYVLATQHQSIEEVRPLAYTASLVLVGLIMLMSGGVVFYRSRIRKRYRQW